MSDGNDTVTPCHSITPTSTRLPVSSGPIIDAGCGPGQLTDYLAGKRVDVEGVDPVPKFIAIARTTYPGVTYWLGPAISASAT